MSHRKTGAGHGMQVHRQHFRFAAKPGPHNDLQEKIVEIRRLLRTDLELPEIAGLLSVTPAVLGKFIRSRRLVNLKERRRFNKLQKNIAKFDVIDERSWRPK